MNLFDYLEKKFNENEEYQNSYDFEDFVKWFLSETFGFNGSIHEGFVDREDDDGFIGWFIPDFDLDFENKKIEMKIEECRNPFN